LPVTLKIRTGWDTENRNALKISKIAEESGVSALTIHGRTRACRFSGNAEYDTIKKIKAQSRIPIIANGDINSVQKAKAVLDYTQADAVMIGRAAQGQPWIFTEINHYLNHGELLPPVPLAEKQITLQQHLEALYLFYGDKMGVQIARKHINWYFNPIGLIPNTLKHKINQALVPTEQMHWVNNAFELFSD